MSRRANMKGIYFARSRLQLKSQLLLGSSWARYVLCPKCARQILHNSSSGPLKYGVCHLLTIFGMSGSA